jgi:hypothetical protein
MIQQLFQHPKREPLLAKECLQMYQLKRLKKYHNFSVFFSKRKNAFLTYIPKVRDAGGIINTKRLFFSLTLGRLVSLTLGICMMLYLYIFALNFNH